MYPESVFLHVPTLKINNTPLEYSNSFAHVGLRIQSVNFIRAVPYGFKYILLLREGPLWRPRQDSNWSKGEKDRSHERGEEWTVAGLDFPRTQIAFPRSTGGGQPSHLRFTVSCRKCNVHSSPVYTDVRRLGETYKQVFCAGLSAKSEAASCPVRFEDL